VGACAITAAGASASPRASKKDLAIFIGVLFYFPGAGLRAVKTGERV
jgi:hypothetical protein